MQTPGCCHIMHICISIEIKALSFDVKVEFSSSAKNVKSLAHIFEREYQEVLLVACCHNVAVTFASC